MTAVAVVAAAVKVCRSKCRRQPRQLLLVEDLPLMELTPPTSPPPPFPEPLVPVAAPLPPPRPVAARTRSKRNCRFTQFYTRVKLHNVIFEDG